MCHFSYVTNDTLANLLGANYFDSAYRDLNKGDVIFASIDMDGTPDFAILRVTNISAAGVVTVADEAPGAAIAGVATGYKIARGQHTTVAASDTVVTGLTTVASVVASLDDNPGDNPFMVSATIGDQNGAPAAGSVIIKSWQNTSGTDPTPAAAATIGKKVNWIAIGT